MDTLTPLNRSDLIALGVIRPTSAAPAVVTPLGMQGSPVLRLDDAARRSAARDLAGGRSNGRPHTPESENALFLAIKAFRKRRRA